MTYVSRRSRITYSRWPDECDTEYILQASRKRSDGRLKRHSSCDDLRAWINDSCIKNEHLVDLMSNGEFSEKQAFQLFGRFIPVPILFKLAQSSTTPNDEAKSHGKQEANVANADRLVQKKYSDSTKRDAEENQKYRGDSRKENFKVKSDSDLTAIRLEKNALEKSLVKCACLLNRALGKLEKIDDIVSSVDEEAENIRNEQIQEAFYKSRLSCSCSRKQSSSARSSLYNFSENLSSSKANMKMQKAKRDELLRKISSLRKKLKKICLQEVIHQIRPSQQKAERRSSPSQVQELWSCLESEQKKGLETNHEKLKAEKDKLVSQLCQAFTAINALKKCSKSYTESKKRDSIPNRNYNSRNKDLQEFGDCRCGCKNSKDLYDSEKFECSELFSAESGLNKNLDELRQMDTNISSDYRTSSTDNPFKSSLNSGDLNLATGKYSEGKLNSSAWNKTPEMTSKLSNPKDASVRENSQHNRQLASSPQKKSETSKKKEEELKTPKKPKLKFVCEESPCRKNIYADDLSAYETSPSKQMIILKAVKNIQNIQASRPRTTPTTKRENLEYQNLADEKNSKPFGNIPERRVKSEATMKEIEKTLRNYEQRLGNIQSLEGRIEELKEKSSEAYQLRKKLKKLKADAKKQRAVDIENFHREKVNLCMENLELKRKIQRLMKKSIAQNHSIQNLNCIMMKFECETEELKKELSEYQVGFEHQQKYISKCECTLAKWGAEIENLRDHIRRLTAIKEASCNQCPENRFIQRSRSYSPEKIKERIIINRPKTQARGYRTPSEEEVPCYCREYDHLKESRSCRQRLMLPIRLLTKSLSLKTIRLSSNIFNMLEDIIDWVFPSKAKSVCVTSSIETSDDWSSILFFIVLIKCRNAIGKMLADEDENLD